jgi:hypothetical protein
VASHAFRPMSLADHIRPASIARRERAALASALASALAEKPCGCGDPDWHVTSTQGRIRYVKCHCGRTDKVIFRTTGPLQQL